MRCVHLSLPVLAVLLVGCVDPGDDSDREAEAAPAQPLGKDDAASLTGLFATSTTTLKSGDIPNLELRADGTFVRRRCYRTSCALPVAESDHYDTYTSSAGKRYIRFYAVRTQWNETMDDREEVPVLADVYEVTTTSTTVKLRKAYTSRWLTLRTTTASSLCRNTAGTWTAGACTCRGAGGWSDSGYIGFIAGLGGCTTIPGAGESECDDTGGWYTDDDATPVGTFCRCDQHSYLTNTGCAPI